MRLLSLILLGAAGALAVRAFAVEGIYIATGSMEPTLHVGRRIFVNKLSYRFRSPRRGEIVVFPSPVEPGKDLVKRVIALEGDEVRIENKKVYLNGAPLAEPYAVFSRKDELLQGDNLDVGPVPRGKVFVLGDNRDASGDSRDWIDERGGHIFFVKVEDIKGTLIAP